MSTLQVTLIQTNLFWEDAPANRAMLEQKILGLTEATQLIVLPEAFTSGFSMNQEQVAETMEGETMQWLKKISEKRNAIITGSLFIQEGNRFFNRMIWMLPNGGFGYYDKRHLFSLAKEQEHYTAGEQRVIAQVNGFKLNLQICYDLRFPVWSRQQSPNEYDVLIYVANWPEARVAAWKTLLQARAIENQCYVIGVNRVGTDGTGKLYNGASSIIHPSGEILYQKETEEDIFTYRLEKSVLENVRNSYPFLADKDNFSIV
jgi:omega-amidase